MKYALIKETKKLSGCVTAPPSKSYTHRAIIAGSLTHGKSEVNNPLFCDDVFATINACSMLGASIEIAKNKMIIIGSEDLMSPNEAIDCKEAASTIRFITPIVALAKGVTTLTGSDSLKKRPIGPLIHALKQLKVDCTSNGGYPPVTIYGGGIVGGKALLAGNVSSQFVTGLLLACPKAENNTTIDLTTPLESQPYVKLTLHVLKKHRIRVQTSKDLRRYHIPNLQEYQPSDHSVPGDFSSAAVLLAAAIITRSVLTVENLSPKDWAPDCGIVHILEDMNVKVETGEDSIKVIGGELKGTGIDAANIPDLIPVCAAIACYAEGETKIYNASRLRVKESDRLETTSSQLKRMGGKIIQEKDGLIIKGSSKMHGAVIDPHRDHRIAMACAVAALGARGETTILQADCVNKSYPNFFKDLQSLGVDLIVR